MTNGNVVKLDAGEGRLGPGHYHLTSFTDVEMAWHRHGDDLTLSVHKGGALVFRVALLDTGKRMTQAQVNFAPDLRFRVGDLEGALRQAYAQAGMTPLML